MGLNRSPIAVDAPSHRNRTRKLKPRGLVVHTSGRGIVARAKKQGKAAIELALAWYRSKGSVHYVIDYDGTIYQMLPDNLRGAHVGISSSERLSYLSGRWEKKVPAKALALWKRRWRGYKSPQHLYSGHSPNSYYLGVELIPLEKARENGLWFTDEQHQAVKELAHDLGVRHDWPRGWMQSPRLVSHGDIDAFARWDNGGSWDVGAMRVVPRFDWNLVVG